MNYSVIWELQALVELEEIYDKSLDKEGLIQALTRIDLELRANPVEAGESREPSTRIMFKFPLVVWFHIDERMKEVKIVHVRGFR